METRNLNIMFAKGGSGSISTRITLPKAWIDEMGLNELNRNVEVTFDGMEISIMKSDMNKDYVGIKWGELTEAEKEIMLKYANTVNGETGNDMYEDGECIVDLMHPYSIPGKLFDGEIVIDDEAVIYNCEEGIL